MRRVLRIAGYIKPGVVAVAGLFRHTTTLTMNKTVIHYRNRTITHYHDHVHLHSPGDWASLWIAAIVMVGVIIAMIAVACLVSSNY